MPLDREKLFAWLDAQEAGDRKNAWVIDKVMVALPIELSHAERAELVTSYAEGMSQGRASWVAAIHDGPGDADNPHAHIIFRDRDAETGKRVMMLSEQGSTERLREVWEREANLALERAGHDARIDRRSLEAQGIEREPEIHVGAAVRELNGRGERPASANDGKTRIEENEERRARNEARARTSADPDLHWTQRAGMVSQQQSAMAWVKSADESAQLSYERAMLLGGIPKETDPQDAALIRAHMSASDDRNKAESIRETSDPTVEIWKSRLSKEGQERLDFLNHEVHGRGGFRDR